MNGIYYYYACKMYLIVIIIIIMNLQYTYLSIYFIRLESSDGIVFKESVGPEEVNDVSKALMYFHIHIYMYMCGFYRKV